jgi:hypothetical protein
MSRNLKPAVDALKQAVRNVRRCDAVIAEVNAERDNYIAKVNHFIEILQLMGEDASQLLGDEVYTPPDQDTRIRMGKGKRMVDETKGRKRGKGMSPKWRSIMVGVIEAYPQEFDNKALRALASELGHDVSRPTAGRQMQDYAAGRYLERLANGKYRATALGAKSLGLKLGKKARKNETPSVGTESVSETDGEGSASPSYSDEKITPLFDR